MKKEEGWYSRKGMGVSHYVLESEGRFNDNGLHFGSLCGAHSTTETPWKKGSGQRSCKRCIAARIKASRKVLPVTTTAPEADCNTPAQANYVQAVGEVTPVTYIAVPDVRVIIDLLKRAKQSSGCRITLPVTATVISALEDLIHEAEERCDRPEVTTTWKEYKE